jgi:hypothetical protein
VTDFSKLFGTPQDELTYPMMKIPRQKLKKTEMRKLPKNKEPVLLQ